MSITFDAKEFKDFCNTSSRYFQYLSRYLILCGVLYRLFPEVDEEPFPPTNETYEFFCDWFFSAKVREERRRATENDEFQEYVESTVVDFYINYRDKFSNLKINLSSINILTDYCLNIRDLYDSMVFYYEHWNEVDTYTKFVRNVILLGHIVSNRSHELIGYLTAKMEEKKRNLQSTIPKTERRKLNKETISDLLKKSEFNVNRELLIEAQRITDRGERTVKNLIKEILEETDK